MHASSINVEVGLEISEERKRRRGDENSLAQRVNTESVTSKDSCRMEMDSGSVGKMANQSAASSSSIEVQGYIESGPKNVMRQVPGFGPAHRNEDPKLELSRDRQPQGSSHSSWTHSSL